jgi:hypothetical protein
LAIAASIALLIILIFLYIVNGVSNILPDYLVGANAELSEEQKKVVEVLYTQGSLIDAKGLYENIVEYYHFLVFLVFALLALVAGFVYLQIRSETNVKINNAIEEKIKAVNIEAKIDEQIEKVEIDKIITEQIDEEALAERISADVIDTTIAEVQTGFDNDMAGLLDEIENLRSALESSFAGTEEELELLTSRIENMETRIEGDE